MLSGSDVAAAPLSSQRGEGGGERAAALSTNQSALPLRRTSADSAGERALPGDTEPSPPQFLTFPFRPLLSSTVLFLFVLFITVISHPSSSPSALLHPPPPPPLPSHLTQGPVKTSCHQGRQQPPLPCHKAITHSSRAKLCSLILLSSTTTVPRL